MPSPQPESLSGLTYPQPLHDPTAYGPPTVDAASDSAINTIIVDSIAADTTTALPHFATASVRDSIAAEANHAASLHPAIQPRPSTAHIGVDPEPLTPNYSRSTPMTALMIGAVAVAAIFAPGLSHTLSAYRSGLWSVRRRRNAFDESYATSAGAEALLAVIFIIFGGIMLYNVHGVPTAPNFGGACIAMSITGVYYILQLIVYNLIGYAFTDSAGRRQWMQGFAASQGFAGIALIIPAILLVNMPEWHKTLIIIALSIYFVSRLIFIAKGFRIFYRNYASLLYFILYLCSLEIIPPMVIYTLTVYIS